MRLTTRSKYGLRAAYFLAEHYEEGPISLSYMVDKLYLSDTYLEQLLRRLKKDELVKSFRGKNGGYQLNRAPDQITIGEVLRSLEGSISSSDCVESFKCRQYDCKTRNIFVEIDEAVNSVVDNKTLKDMI